MGLMKIFSNLFKKEEIKEKKILSLEDVESFFNKQVEESVERIQTETKEISKKIFDEFQNLKEILSEFIKKGIEEERAQASKKVKDRFCEKSVGQIEKLENDITEAEILVKNIGGITPKQLMHLRFFFREDINKVTAKLKGIESLIKNYRELMDSKEIRFKEEITNLLNKIVKNKKKIEENENKLEEIEKGILNLTERKNKRSDEIKKYASVTNENDKTKKEIEFNVNERKRIEQFIDSEFGSVNKLLKKYKHYKEMEDEILDMYISSPSGALLQDNKLKIKNILLDSVALAENKEIDAEQKRLDKAESIIENLDSLKNEINKINEIEKTIIEKESYMNEYVIPKIREKEECENEIKRISKETEEKEKQKEFIRSDIEKLKKDIERIKDEMETKLSDVLNRKIKVKE